MEQIKNAIVYVPELALTVADLLLFSPSSCSLKEIFAVYYCSKSKIKGSAKDWHLASTFGIRPNPGSARGRAIKKIRPSQIYIRC